MINHREKIIFFHVPKCAGFSVGRYLGTYKPLEKIDHRSWLEILPASTVIADYWKEVDLFLVKRFIRNVQFGLSRFSLDQINDYRKVAVIRNPYARAVSWYLNVQTDPKHLKKHGGVALSFDDFIKTYLNTSWAFRSQFNWLQSPDGKYKVDYLIRMETLEADLDDLLKKLNYRTGAPLPKLHMETAYDWQDYYKNPETATLVREKYRVEFETFGYSMDIR